jgi:hypothetical protein
VMASMVTPGQMERIGKALEPLMAHTAKCNRSTGRSYGVRVQGQSADSDPDSDP